VKKVFVILVPALFLAACSSLQASGDRYNLEYIRDGMTRDEVVEIMRNPKACAHFDDEEVMVWNGASISLVSGHVIDKTALEGEKANRLARLITGKDPKAEALIDECFKNNSGRSPASEIVGDQP
jgi:hypothetical protein